MPQSYKRHMQRGVHILVAERVLGRRLPKGAVVHHVDEDIFNNAPDNLVICPSRSYHFLLHHRMTAMAACGNPAWRKCTYCGQYDAPSNQSPDKNGHHYHRDCAARHTRFYYRLKRLTGLLVTRRMVERAMSEAGESYSPVINPSLN